MINDYLQTNAWNMQCLIQTWFPDSNQLKKKYADAIGRI